MELRQSLSCRLELRLEEPVGYAQGPRSPLIKGLPIGEYKRIAPEIKIIPVDPYKLTFTDNPSSFETFYDVQKEWEDSLIDSATKTQWKLPLICPPVVDKDNFIQDGNHRCASANLHTNALPVILIESQADLDAIARLEEKGVFYWPHGKISFEGLMKKRNELALESDISDFLDNLGNLRRRDFPEEYEEDDEEEINDHFPNGILFSNKPKKEKLVAYCVGIALHQNRPKFLGKTDAEPVDTIHNWYVNLDNLDPKEVYLIVRKIAEKNPLVTDQTLYTIDDCVQDAMILMKTKFKRERKK